MTTDGNQATSQDDIVWAIRLPRLLKEQVDLDGEALLVLNADKAGVLADHVKRGAAFRSFDVSQMKRAMQLLSKGAESAQVQKVADGMFGIFSDIERQMRIIDGETGQPDLEVTDACRFDQVMGDILKSSTASENPTATPNQHQKKAPARKNFLSRLLSPFSPPR